MNNFESFTYCPQIPIGKARTKGHGTTVRMLVIVAPTGFKTRNSAHHVIYDGGLCRSDYGKLRGKYRHERDLMIKAFDWFNTIFPSDIDKQFAYENQVRVIYDARMDNFIIKK